MVAHGRVELLCHPVCLTYLHMKWSSYGFFFHVINMGLYLLFVALLTGIICYLDPKGVDGEELVQSVIANDGNGTMINGTIRHPPWEAIAHISLVKSLLQMPGEHTTALAIPMTIVMVMLLVNMLKEFVQMYQQRLAYVADLVNYVEWTLYVTSTIFILPMLVSGQLHMFQWKCGAIAIFFAWFNLLMYLQRYSSCGSRNH